MWVRMFMEKFCWRKVEMSLSLQSRNVSVTEGISSQRGTRRDGVEGSNFLFADIRNKSRLRREFALLGRLPPDQLVREAASP
jgi:hypothetical protein